MESGFACIKFWGTKELSQYNHVNTSLVCVANI